MTLCAVVLTTFRGLPCYSTEATIPDRSTAANRLLIANGFGFRLEVDGTANPVEQRADFDAIMNGFEFTSPPIPPTANAVDPIEKLSRAMGGVAAFCLFGALVVGLVFLLSRKKRRR